MPFHIFGLFVCMFMMSSKIEVLPGETFLAFDAEKVARYISFINQQYKVLKLLHLG